MMNKSGKITSLKAYLLDRYEQETKTKLNLQDPADQEVFQQYLKNNKDKLIHEHRDILADKTSTREIIRAFLRDERAEKIIQIRERFGLDTIPLSDLLKIIEYDGSRNYSLINGEEDQFIRSLLHSKKHELDLDQISLPGLDNNIKFQIDTWIAELVSNGLDATAPEHSIGKFGSGFLACLNTLGTQAESITVTTKKKHSPAYQLVFSLKNKQIVVKTTHIQTDFDHGTQISIQRNGEPLDSNQLIKELGRKFDSNNTAPININGEQINDLDKFTWSKPINFYAKSPVNVTASDNLVTVTDHGTGMDAHNLLYHLIFPKHGAKQPKTYTDKELEKIIDKEVCFGYTTGSQPQTIVRCTIAGVGIEEFTIPKQGMIDNLTLILPSVGYVPESRNQIVGTKEILLGLQHLLDQVADSTDSIQQKVDILGGIAGAIRVIEERKTSEGISGKLSLTKYAQKTIFPKLLDQIKSEGKVAIQSHPATKMIVGQNLNFVLIDPLFVSDIDATLLPNCQKLDDIKTEKKLTATRHGETTTILLL